MQVIQYFENVKRKKRKKKKKERPEIENKKRNLKKFKILLSSQEHRNAFPHPSQQL